MQYVSTKDSRQERLLRTIVVVAGDGYWLVGFEQGTWENIPDVRGREKTVETKMDVTFPNKQHPIDFPPSLSTINLQRSGLGHGIDMATW